MNLKNENERLGLVLSLRDALYAEFPLAEYNIFCFGSFLTADYRDGKSDIDLGVYCPDKMQRIAIEDSIENFLREKAPALKKHILPVELVPRRWLNANILAGTQFTAYFPKTLKAYLYGLRHDLRFHNERMAHREFVTTHNAHLSVRKRMERMG